MEHESVSEEVLTPEQLSDRLAEGDDVTGTEIERRADEMEIAPPEEATVVDE